MEESMTNFPTGTVTFLFSDIEGSTKIAQAYPDQWEMLRGRHHEILRGAIAANNGYVFKIVGDEFCSAFHNASDALKAALAAQQGLQSERWSPATIKVRMGINTGAAQLENPSDPRSDYTGYSSLARVARVMAAGHGGQILLSNSSAEPVRESLPENVSLLDMGEHRMKGLLAAEHLWQVTAPGLAPDFPPLKTLTAIPDSQAEQIASFVEREKGIAEGLEKLEAELPIRAPVLMEKFQELAGRLRSAGVERTYKERYEALIDMNNLCLEALDISFIMLCIGEAPPTYDARCPFRGLESFRPEDSEFFFGREVLINKLVDKIEAHSFLAVLGASGSGKSSLVMAGLIPALKCEYAIFRPGADPLAELESALSSVNENALIVVDQFEETFTLTTNEATRKEFISRVLAATQRYKVVLTLRSDFLGEVAAHRALNEEIQNHLENVPPMNMDELYQSMAGQAGRTGLRFEADLGQQILDDVEGEPGAMPLLQHALWMLWKRRHGFWLKSSEYQSFGGVRQAIASTAEEVYASCSETERGHMREIFLRLTRLDESNEGRDTRRRVPLSDLAHIGQSAAARSVLLDKLANERLIVKTVDIDTVEIEVAHEALIRHWERLQSWLNEDRTKLHLRESVGESAKEWKKAKKDETLLNHRGGRLDDALLLGSDPRYSLTALEQEYLNACLALRNREQLARERRLRWTVVASILAAVIFLALGIFGLLKSNEATEQASVAQTNANAAVTAQAHAETNANVAATAQAQAEAHANEAAIAQTKAEEQAQLALARQLASEAQNLVLTIKSKQALAFLFAVQSMKIDPSAEASQVLLTKNFAAHLISRVTHADSAYSIAFSPDGKYVVSGSYDGTARVWKPETGVEISRVTHDGKVYSVAFSPDGKYVVSGSADHTARVWEAATGIEIARMTHAGEVYSVAFSPDGKYVVSGSEDNTARVWETTTGNELARVAYDSWINSVAFSRDGKYVVSGSADFTARVWEAITGKEIARMTHDSWVNSVAFSPDGKYVVSGSYDGTARVWEVITGNEIARMTHESSVDSVAFSPDGKYVVSGSEDNTARVWAAATGEEIARMTHDGPAWIVAFSPDGKYVVSGSTDKTARMWEAATGTEIARMTHDDSVLAVAFSADGRYVVSGSDDKTARVWEPNAEKSVTYMNHDNAIRSIAFSPDGKYVVSGSSDGTARVWEATTGKEIARMTHADGVPSVAFSPDGKYVVSGSDDHTARVWEAITGREISRMTHDDGVLSVAFSPDGKYVVSGSYDGTARVWEVATGKEIARMTHADGVLSVAFSPDGNLVVSGSWDGTVRVWEAATGKEVARMTHDNYVTSVTFSPDGKYVVSGSEDNTARVWEAATGKEIARMTYDSGEHSVIQFE
jgi:uncharacterized delta-60 repeat protein